jgi:hypothetical protein
MRQLMGRLWHDDQGALLAVEWVFIATILVIGSVCGLVAVRQAIVEELEDFAEAILSLCTTWHFHDSDDVDDDDSHGHNWHHHHDNGQHKGHGHGDDFNRHLRSIHHGDDD